MPRSSGNPGLHGHIGHTQPLALDEATGEDDVEQRGLFGLEQDETTQDMEEVEQVGRVLVRPVVGLDVPQRRGLAAVADDRAGAVALAVAESLAQHVHARHIVSPDGGRHVVDMAVADVQPLCGDVVCHLIG
jgi:hypothetical protein